jgi:hypothetical protein
MAYPERSDLKLPINGWIDPSRRLKDRSKYSSFVRAPMFDGIRPEMVLLLRLRWAR